MVAIARRIFRPSGNLVGFKYRQDGKLNLSGQLIFGTHRSGWKFALEGLQPLHNRSGIRFDGYLENTFGWRIDEAAGRGEIPYRNPWVGIAHHPQNMPQFLEYRTAPQHVFNNYYMKESLPYCHGIFVMSQYYKDWLAEMLGPSIPIHVLMHPTEGTDKTFEIESFMANQDKQIVSIGHWLRRLRSIKLLPVSKYRKTWVVADKYSKEVQEGERFSHTFSNDLGLEVVGQYSETNWLNNDQYDQLLSENIVFLDYYDCSASNTIVECIVRNTPCLVNKHPAIVEYFGDSYPFYYESLEEAANKAQSLDVIEDTFDYLLELDKSPFTQDYFRGSLINSDIYKKLPGNLEAALNPVSISAEFDTLESLNIEQGEPLRTDYVFAICFRNLTWKLTRCIDIIIRQNRDFNFGVALVDDCSDQHSDISSAIQLLEISGIPFVLVKNPTRQYLCRNLYNITLLLAVNPEAVIIQVDGDDYLSDADVLSTLDEEYKKGALITFGSFNAIGSEDIPQNIKHWVEPQKVSVDDCWDIDLCCSWMHLKTYRKSLLEQVPKHYFLEKNGKKWLRTGEDLCVQPKMVEIAEDKVRYIEEKLYVYDLSGADHELLDDEKPRYIVENVYRLPHGSYIGECLNMIQTTKQNKRLKAANAFDS